MANRLREIEDSVTPFSEMFVTDIIDDETHPVINICCEDHRKKILNHMAHDMTVEEVVRKKSS